MRQFTLKTTGLWTLAVSAFLSTSSFSQIKLNDTELLKCTLIKMDSRLGSFIPPKVGDTIEIDLSKNELEDLKFTGTPNAYIPITTNDFKLTKIKHDSEWTSHMRFFEGADGPADRPGYRMQLVIGAYGDGNLPIEKQRWSAKIQVASTAKEMHWTLAQAELTCIPIHL